MNFLYSHVNTTTNLNQEMYDAKPRGTGAHRRA